MQSRASAFASFRTSWGYKRAVLPPRAGSRLISKALSVACAGVSDSQRIRVSCKKFSHSSVFYTWVNRLLLRSPALFRSPIAGVQMMAFLSLAQKNRWTRWCGTLIIRHSVPTRRRLWIVPRYAITPGQFSWPGRHHAFRPLPACISTWASE